MAYATGLLDGTVVVDGLDVDTDFRWHVVGTLASAGADDDGALVAAELELDPTDIGERRAASALASRPTPAAKAEAWMRLDGEAALPLALLRAIAGSVGQYTQEELLRPYVRRYLSSLPGWWDQRTRDEVISLARGLFPSTLIDPETVAAVDAALAGATLPPLRRILAEGKDGLERALRARATDHR